MSSSETNSTVSSGELLSSFMDGELTRESSRFIVRSLMRDEQLQSSWTRWHAVRHCLRENTAVNADLDLASRVSAALTAEDQPAAGAGVRPQRWLRPLVSAGIAATVAMAAIIGVNQYRSGNALPEALPGAALVTQQDQPPVSRAPSIPLVAVPVGLTETRSQSQAGQQQSNRLARARLESYLMRHYHHSRVNNGAAFARYLPAAVSQQASAAPAGAAGEAETQVQEATVQSAEQE